MLHGKASANLLGHQQAKKDAVRQGEAFNSSRHTAKMGVIH